MSFLLWFVLSLLGLSLIYNLEIVAQTLIKPWNQVLATAASHALGFMGIGVNLHQNVLTSPSGGFAVAVENDCNGAEATLILVAAMLAFPAGLARKATGILSGVVLIQVVNVIRILALYQVGQWSDALFDLTHKYLWPALIIVVALGFFLAWVKRTSLGSEDA